MGVEFQEIRQGDRPLLDYVLNRLKKPRTEDFADLEVITEPLEAVGGIEIASSLRIAGRDAHSFSLVFRRRADAPLCP